jgi:hypothetical protein
MFVMFVLVFSCTTDESPAPFTQITNKEICDGIWVPRVEEHLEWAKHYTSALEAKGRYTLIIWPEHCIVRGAGRGQEKSVLVLLLSSMFRVPNCCVITLCY